MTSVAVPARMDVRRQSLVAAVVLVAVYLVVFGPGIVLSVRSLAGDAPGPALDWQARVAAVEWDVFGVAVVVAVVLRWLPSRAPDVAARLGTRVRISPARFVTAALAFVAVALASAWLGGRVVSVLHLSSGTNTQIGRGVGAFVVGSAASVAAALTEEIVLVALPVALIARAAGRHRAAVPATLATMLVVRLLPHLYYGWDSVFVVFWTVGAYAVFRATGSIWPLVAGHAAYDLVAVGVTTLTAR